MSGKSKQITVHIWRQGSRILVARRPKFITYITEGHHRKLFNYFKTVLKKEKKW